MDPIDYLFAFGLLSLFVVAIVTAEAIESCNSTRLKAVCAEHGIAPKDCK